MRVQIFPQLGTHKPDLASSAAGYAAAAGNRPQRRIDTHSDFVVSGGEFELLLRGSPRSSAARV
jgi:hypothetical protein